MSLVSLLDVGIPVWNGAKHVAECIASLRAQSFGDFRAVVSIDLSSDASAKVARRAIDGDGRFEIVHHPRRLGWVGNCNFLLDRIRRLDRRFEPARGGRFAFLPQDDLLAPDYFETLLAEVEAVPEAAVVYSDLEIFGEVSWVIEQPSLRGPVIERALDFLRHHFNAVGFRGAVRGDLARRHRLEQHAAGGFAADTLWLFELALAGELVRVPTVAYHKRVHGGSMVARWKRRDPEAARKAWIAHCSACAQKILHPELEPHRAVLQRALEDRLLQRHAPLWPQVAPPEAAADAEISAWETALLADFRRASGTPVRGAV